MNIFFTGWGLCDARNGTQFFRIRVKTIYSQNEDSDSGYGYSELSLRSRLSLASGLEFSQPEVRIMAQIIARTRALTSIMVRA